MDIIHSTEKVSSPTALTIGVFDGVHIGHQQLLKQVDQMAKKENLLRCVVTFDVHPLSVLAPDHAPRMLLSLNRKLELLEQSGLVDFVLVIAFNPVRAAQSAVDFVKEVLVEQLSAREVLVGSNFVFGHERRGNFALLKEMGEENNFMTHSIDLLLNESQSPVSSTLIRQYISVGNMNKASELLTRQHELTGLVVHGDKMGRKLGFPTANTQVEESMSIPSDGVYRGSVVLGDGRIFKSAISIGIRPMFHDDNIRVIEPHLLDFDEEIYGETITILFEEKLREQMVFNNVDELIVQMNKDVKKVSVQN